MSSFFDKVKAFLAQLWHHESDALAPIVQAAVNDAVREAPVVVVAGLSDPKNAVKIAGAALTKIGHDAAASALNVTTQTLMVEVSHALDQHPAMIAAKAAQ